MRRACAHAIKTLPARESDRAGWRSPDELRGSGNPLLDNAIMGVDSIVGFSVNGTGNTNGFVAIPDSNATGSGDN